MRTVFLNLCLSGIALASCDAQTPPQSASPSFEVVKTPQEWKKALGAERYRILIEKGTEAPWSGEYNLHFENGIYHCGACQYPLFESSSKFDSHCGWPSFDAPIDEHRIVETVDRSHGMTRTEIQCARCGGHLGHVFNDGPTATGLRYCVNSLSLGFEPQSDSASAKPRTSSQPVHR
ncbi:peptide-methionine (R)-S-oxide reductase MsrB [bacterium]|nr:peptide-methionine (R)-S-oxide reductase MsrB [bacterium]